MSARNLLCGPLCLAATVLVCALSAHAATNVAVFNFQMTSETPEWRWLEKGLSDRLATDFTQDRGLAVVARDEMQILAQAMHWVPEMATSDPERMKQIHKKLRIEFLATGVYRVEGDRIHITGQVVEVETRRELARKEVSGTLDEVLILQRRLSAELLGWFSKRPPEAILERLPVWTRSLPAMRALYEGMDLYDQGRYGEAWLRFRLASREDPEYVEAQYWVGKMYYFMNRYRHARRALERFVYMDATHPRLGDALMEYVHTYENIGAPPETLLKMYEDLGQRYPDASIWEGGFYWGWQGRMESAEWFLHKRVLLMLQLGRNREVADLTGVTAEASREFSRSGIFVSIRRQTAVSRYHALTAKTLGPEVHLNANWPRERRMLLCFGEAARPMVRSLNEPARILGENRRDLDKMAVFNREKTKFEVWMTAPDAHVFQSVKFYPLVDGADGSVQVALRLPDVKGSFRSAYVPLGEAATSGIAWDALPGAKLLTATCHFRVDGPDAGPILVKGIRVEARLRRLEQHGCLEVVGANTPLFRVEVDGFPYRWGSGLVGPLEPGEHIVRIRPFPILLDRPDRPLSESPFAESLHRVVIEPGKTTRLDVRLPWKGDSVWREWQSTLIAREYPGYDHRLHKPPSAAGIQADDEAVRIVWAARGDLWIAESTDGETFTPPRKLALPVSSGWLETHPHLLRDEAGRFVLWFTSDRNAQHTERTYGCWSRDLVHWSAPAINWPEFENAGYKSYINVRFSRSGYTPMGPTYPEPRGGPWKDVFGKLAMQTPLRVSWWAARAYPNGGWPTESGGPPDARLAVPVRPAPQEREPRVPLPPRARQVADAYDAAWEKITFLEMGGDCSMTYHPRWGYLIAWTHNPSGGPPPYEYPGPFLLRG